MYLKYNGFHFYNVLHFNHKHINNKIYTFYNNLIYNYLVCYLILNIHLFYWCKLKKNAVKKANMHFCAIY